MRSWRRAVLIAGALAVVAGGALAQGPVLHEFVPDVSDDEALVLAASDSPEPAAIVYDGEVIPAPQDGALRPEERPMSADPGDGHSGEEVGRRSPTFRPDRVTELEGTLGYYSVFTPTIAPFKRVTALDAVVLAEDGRTPVLVVEDETTTEVPVVGASAAPPDQRERDRFWGSVVLDFSAGRQVPLPSVSPESRILTIRTEPEVALRIVKDRADNFFAEAVGYLPSRQIRATFLSDAPRVYFNSPIPTGTPSDVFADQASELPPPVRRSAEVFARELGIERGMPLDTVLSALTLHYRSFEESDEEPPDTGDIYLDLSRAKKGVCRHRAYGFVITALALGIPARFVMNEAHAWVEVHLPTVGWMRIDLGGAAEGLDARNARERPVYRSVFPDPLPRPPEYQRAYSNGNVRGTRQDDGTGAAGAAAGAGAGAGAGGGASTPGPPPTQSYDPSSDRVPLAVSVDRSRYEVFRGRSVDVSGRVIDDAGRGVDGLRLEVLLMGEREMLLGVTVSRENGYYRGSFGVPPDVPVGEYRLSVRTPGSDQYAPSQAL